MNKSKAVVILFLIFINLKFEFVYQQAGFNSSKNKIIEFPSKLKLYLSPNQVDSFIQAKQIFDNIKTSNDLYSFYKNILPPLYDFILKGVKKSNPEVVTTGDNSPAEIWRSISDYLQMIEVGALCSECEFVPITNIKPFLQKAATTAGLEDDKYFEFLVALYGESTKDSIVYEQAGNINNYYSMDGCDFCAFSTLGDGKYYTIIIAYNKALNVGNLFKTEIQQYFNFLQWEHTHYGESKINVLKEIDKIILNCKLEPDKVKIIKAARNKINLGRNIQFNCKRKQCKYDY